MNRTAQPTIVSKVENRKPCKDKNVFSFVTTFIDGFGFVTRIGGQFATKSQGCESLEKYDNTMLEGVQLQDECTPLKVRVLHHKDVTLRSNLKMTPEAILHSLVWLRACKM
jgi:hypothetical protein